MGGGLRASLRSAIFIAALLFVARDAHAAVAVGASATANGTVSGAVTTAKPTWSVATANGSLLVAILTYNGTPTIAATGWTLATSIANGTNVSTAIYYIQNAAAQTSATFTATGATTGPALTVQLLELKGMMTANALDVTATAKSAGLVTSLTVTPTSTTTFANEVAIFAFAGDNASPNHKWGNVPTGYTALSNLANTTRSISGYDTTVSMGSTLTTTMTQSKTATMVGAVVSFKAVVNSMYWRGGSSDCASGSNWTSPTCWATTSGGASSGGTPSATNAVVFESAKKGDCTISSAITPGSITVESGYTGTITHSSGNISLSGSFVMSSGTTAIFNSTATSGSAIRTNQSGTYDGDLLLESGTFTVSAAPLGLRGLSVSGGAFTSGTSAVTTNNAGLVTLSGGSANFGSGGLNPVGAVTVSGATTVMGSAAFTVSSQVTVSAGTLTFGSGNVAFNGGLSIEGTGAVTLGTGTTQTATTVDVSSSVSPALTFATGSTFTSTDVFSQSDGTVTANNATLTFGSGVAAGSDGFTMTGGTFSAGTSTLSVGIAGKNGGQTTTINDPGATFDGWSGTQHFYGVLNATAGSTSLGTADMVSSRNGGGANTDQQVTVGAGAYLNLHTNFTFPSTVAMTIAGTINAGLGTVTVTPAVTISGSGRYDVQQSNTTFKNTVTINGVPAVFWGGVGSTTFSVAPVFTSGTFQVGNAATTGTVIFTAGATFASGMTVAFPTSGGTLSAPGGQTIAFNGLVTSSAGAITARPKIARSSGTTGIGISFGSTSVLNIDGLELDNAVATGVTIADGATYTMLKNLKFQNNVANSITGGATHLAITSSNTGGTKVLQIPGCYFDATAQYNVTLSGVSASTGVRAIFEFQSTATNGARAGAAYDLDADANGDNVADPPTAAPRYGSVVEWVQASPTDTVGTSVGFPTAAFDWNTFQWYAVYVAYKDTSGAASADIIWNRNTDGSPAYSYSVPQTSGDIVGTPKWDTVNEVTKGVDANGDGDQLDTDVRVVYVPTSLGHIIKLIDTGSGLARPTQGAWASDFVDSNVSTITSAFALDGTNLYFGGTGSSTTKVFAVQVAGGTNEAKLVKTIGAVSAITTTPSVTTSGGSTYVFLGSTATANQAYIYRINMTNLIVDGSYTGSTTSINGGVVLINGRAYAASDGGKVYALDALNFNMGGFTDLAGFPYTAGSAAVKNAPWVDYSTNYAYFGDDGGKVYAINASGAALTNFPLTISASIKITSTPIYIGSGVIAIGANDGYLYFIDRNNGTGPSIFKRYFITGSGSISNVAYNTNTSTYMVSSSDGKLTFVNASDVTDPTAGSQ